MSDFASRAPRSRPAAPPRQGTARRRPGRRRRGRWSAWPAITRPRRRRRLRLAAAQLVIARELGFPSWPTAQRRCSKPTLLPPRSSRRSCPPRSRAGCGRPATSCAPIPASPGAACSPRRCSATPRRCASTSPPTRGRRWPSTTSAAGRRCSTPATPAGTTSTPTARPGWPRWCALLLAAGASANTNDGGRARYRSALKGSVEVNNPRVTEVLLEAGANPDPGQPIAEAAAHRDLRCLRPAALARRPGDQHLGAGGGGVQRQSRCDGAAARRPRGERRRRPRTRRARSCPTPPPPRLLPRSWSPSWTPEPTRRRRTSTGCPRCAWRYGRAGRRPRPGCGRSAPSSDGTEVDRFLGACLNADRPAAGQLLADHPDLMDRLTDEDRAVICQAAESRPAETLALMLELGFSPNAATLRRTAPARRRLPRQRGRCAGAAERRGAGRCPRRAVRIDRVGVRHRRQRRTGGETGRLDRNGAVAHRGRRNPGRRVDHGQAAERGGRRPPDALRHHPRRAEPQPLDQDDDHDREVPGSLGTGVMAEIARHLETAARDLDLDLLGSLLHPEVHWTGLCNDRSPGARLVSRGAGRGNRGQRAKRRGRPRRRGARPHRGPPRAGRPTRTAATALPGLHRRATPRSSRSAATPTVPACGPSLTCRGLISALTRGRPSARPGVHRGQVVRPGRRAPPGSR